MKVAIAARNLRGKTGVSAIVLEHIRQVVIRGGTVDVYGEKLDKELVTAAGGNPIRFRRLPLSPYAARRFFSYRVDQKTRTGSYDLVIGNSELLHQDVTFVHNLTALESELVPNPVSKGMAAKMRFDQTLFSKGSFKICIANSQLTKNDLVNRHGLNPEKIHVVYPGYDPKAFSTANRQRSRDQLRPELCGPHDFLIGFITSGHFAKRGADIMLKAVANLPNSVKQQVRVLALGSDNNIEKLRTQFREHHLEGALVTAGKTDNIGPYFHAIDLLFHPARIEEFGLVVIEAVASGCPALISDVVGAAELFKSSPSNNLVCKNKNDFSQHLENLINNPDELRVMSIKQKDAITNYAWSDYFSKLFSLYEGIAEP